MAAKLEKLWPTIYVKPKLLGIGTGNLDKIDSVYEQAQPAIDQFEEELRRLLGL